MSDPGGNAPSPAETLVSPAFPTAPLAATLAVQIVATTAAYSITAVAPEIARELGVNPALAGLYLSTVYGVGIVSALLSPGPVYRYGAVRVNQAVLVGTLAMLATAAYGSLAAIALSAGLMGLAYGATAPASTHLLVPRTLPAQLNLVLSIRQVGVPFAGMLAGLLMPPLTLFWSWQTGLLVQIVPAVFLLLLLQPVRRKWDRPSINPAGSGAGLMHPLRMMRHDAPLRRLSFASFVYSGLQGCFVAFMTTHLTSVAGFDLVRAGQMLALYQLSGAVTRPMWGWLADRVLAARWLLAMQGLIMAAMALLVASFDATWPGAAVLATCAVAGSSASGFTGIAYGEYARLGGTQRTAATGLGAASMFAGIMILPALMSLAVIQSGSYRLAYMGIAALALSAGALLLRQRG